jgi:hypothetical protein
MDLLWIQTKRCSAAAAASNVRFCGRRRRRYPLRHKPVIRCGVPVSFSAPTTTSPNGRATYFFCHFELHVNVMMSKFSLLFFCCRDGREGFCHGGPSCCCLSVCLSTIFLSRRRQFFQGSCCIWLLPICTFQSFC